MHAVVARRAIPAREQERPFCSTWPYRSLLGLKVIWWMSVPSAFITCSTNADSLRSSVGGFELRLALVEQDGLGLALARRGEQDAAVG